MIVDDNPRIRKVIREILSTTFDEFLEHNDGEGASLIYKEFNPDWVVMDIKMEKIDGLKATREILIKYPSAKIVIVSHFSDEETQRQALKAGAKLFLSKENLTELTELF